MVMNHSKTEVYIYCTNMYTTIMYTLYIAETNNFLSLSTVVLNSRDQQGMYGMQHFRAPRNPPYKRV